MSNIFRTIDDKLIRWTDKSGVIHAVEGADVHRGVRLLWTPCERDVPANTAWLLKPTDHPEICPICMSHLHAMEAA